MVLNVYHEFLKNKEVKRREERRGSEVSSTRFFPTNSIYIEKRKSTKIEAEAAHPTRFTNEKCLHKNIYLRLRPAASMPTASAIINVKANSSNSSSGSESSGSDSNGNDITRTNSNVSFAASLWQHFQRTHTTTATAFHCFYSCLFLFGLPAGNSANTYHSPLLLAAPAARRRKKYLCSF
ncbi:unnamed protein product [Ceratitis capitata]|uniref:(Mediterranean fruit fly) hypothetical protein n=1 Tax=Ceratitis capitata TaxID=7213 RepID=A0A811UY05_CERCA|nr:unnamed protein product [Ceratitis capitata]